jgi:CDP-diacylglycerol--serine O-phosphatidyltransferase
MPMDEMTARDEKLLRRQARRKRMVAVVPSLLTLGNAVCGFGCITYAAKVGPQAAEPNDLNDLCFAGLLIFAAMVFDALDGPIARFARLTSDFGAELDSLSDAISFGVAPAFLMLKFSALYHPALFLHPRLLWVIAILYMMCAILRLARFNVTKDGEPQHEFFRGLPSPAAAGMVASLVIIAPGLEQLTAPEMTATARWMGNCLLAVTATTLPLITLCVACLMVSKVRYPHLFNHFFHGRHTFQHFVKLIFTLVIVFLVHESIAILFLYFVLASPVQWLWRRFVARRAGTIPAIAASGPPA